MKKDFTQLVKIIILGFVLSLGAGYLLAAAPGGMSGWTGPASAPPAANLAAPLNATASAQSKGGNPISGSLLDVNGALSAEVLKILVNVVIGGSVTMNDLAGNGTQNLCVISDGTIVLCSAPPPPVLTCTFFTYSAWGLCQPDNTQTRTVTGSSPAGCTGGNPILSQSCTYTGKIVVAPLSVLPAVTTGSVTNMDMMSMTSYGTGTADGGGNVTSDGGASITAKGVVWSTTANPIISYATKTNNGTGTGTFTSNITGLTAGTTYHVRAYAINSAGTAYGADVSFTTPTTVPIVATDPMSYGGNSGTDLLGNGALISTGGINLTTKGIRWIDPDYPNTPHDLVATLGNTGLGATTGAGTFAADLTTGGFYGGTPGKTFYIKAYAANSLGASFGNQITYTVPWGTPIVTTASPMTNITGNSATGSGMVTSGGGIGAGYKGLVWGTSSNPTVALSTKTAVACGTSTTNCMNSSITGNLTGLSSSTTYHVRAYYTNAGGVTGYGSDVSFTTLP